MCLICEEYKKGKLKIYEAIKNLEEMKPNMEPVHYDEVYKKLYNEYLEQELEEFWESIGFGD